MKSYQRILVGVELDGSVDSLIIAKAQEIQRQTNAELVLLHTVEHLSNYGAAYGVSAGVDVEEVLIQESKKTMAALGQQLGVPVSRQLVKLGPPSQVIIEEAQELPVDLIIIGSHGRHGVRLLLGSTANSVLHGAPCDVLAVRLKS